MPPGWSEWYGDVDPTTHEFRDYTLNDSGNPKTYGEPGEKDPDLYIERRAAGGKPFLLSFAPRASHREIVADRELLAERNPGPAPRHRGTFEIAEVPRPPSLDGADAALILIILTS